MVFLPIEKIQHHPDVAQHIKTYMKTKAGNGHNQYLPMPKIITIVRNPLERSYSSYNYNYIQPNLAKIKQNVEKALLSSTTTNYRNYDNQSNDIHNQQDIMIQTIILENMTEDQIIDKYFFSFEELIEAEMILLKECLKKGGQAEQDTKELYSTKKWAQSLFQERKREQTSSDESDRQSKDETSTVKSDLPPPLISLDESCYGGIKSSSVPRRQWEKLVELYPEKIINVDNLHVVQLMLGRSLYSLPLEWWYAMYPKKDLYIVCNEDLKNHPSETMSRVSEFLGLPTFNFDPVVSKGLYNVGENRGYDKVTTWKEGNDTIHRSSSGDGVQISDELREKYLAFVKPYNERLFEMTGIRCNWQ